MTGYRTGFLDDCIQLEGHLSFSCTKCGKRVRKTRTFTTLATQNPSIRDAIRPLLAREVAYWKFLNQLFCDHCRPKYFDPRKWPNATPLEVYYEHSEIR